MPPAFSGYSAALSAVLAMAPLCAIDKNKSDDTFRSTKSPHQETDNGTKIMLVRPKGSQR